VTRVWKLDQPCRVVDFGCGYGKFGTMLLPLLPGLCAQLNVVLCHYLAFTDMRWSVVTDTLFPRPRPDHCTEGSRSVPSGSLDAIVPS